MQARPPEASSDVCERTRAIECRQNTDPVYHEQGGGPGSLAQADRRGEPESCRGNGQGVDVSGVGSWGTTISRASGCCARTATNAESSTCSSGGHVEPATSVGAPRPNRRRGSFGAVARTRRSTLSKRGSPRTRTAERGTPRVTSRAASASEIAPAAATLAVARREELARRPSKPAASCRDRPRDDGDGRSARGGARGELGPEIELREDEEIGAKRFKEPIGGGRQIVREEIGGVGRDAAGQRLGGGAEVGVDELGVGAELAELFEHALGLEPLAHRRGVQPHQRAVRDFSTVRPIPPGGFRRPGARGGRNGSWRRRGRASGR